ncbi:MAG TPA: DUF4157 domain-containing protein [Candidatus Deferrimicrobium sp.]|nr:DUF4157 domain-containing protein [Candidatus Deferrimicrobium sp.]
MFQKTGLQHRLITGRPGDALEREADMMADVATGRRGTREHGQADALYGRITPLVQCQTEEEQTTPETQPVEKDEKVIQAQVEDEEEQPTQAQAEEEEPVQSLVEPKEEEPIRTKVEEEEKDAVQARAEKDEEKPVGIQAEEEEEERPVQAEAEEEKEEAVQPKLEAPGVGQMPDDIRGGFKANGGNGSPLAEDVRAKMEAQFGAEFSGVRIHTDNSAVQLTRLLKARAFTHGRDIYFNDGRFSPGTRSGEHLIAHELTHTIQQGAVARSEIQQETDVTAIQRKEDDDTSVTRPELLEAIRVARGEIGKVNAKETDSERRRLGWERLHQYFVTAFGGKEVIHRDIIEFIQVVQDKQGITSDAMPSWCGIFVWWAYKKAGIPVPDWKLDASILSSVATRSSGELPQKGDIAYHKTFDHLALVSDVEDAASRQGKDFTSTRVATVNGNTSGSDNLGGQIEEKWEPVGRWLTFFNPVARLNMPPVALVETGVQPETEFAEAAPAEGVAPSKPVEDVLPTKVDALYQEVASESEMPEAEAVTVDVELPAPPQVTEEKVAKVEQMSLEGSSDEAMVAFIEASPSQMAATQPVLGQKLDRKINQEKKDEGENAPVLVAHTSGQVEEGLTPPGEIPIPGEVQLGDDITEADPGDLQAGAHENIGETPSNEKNEKLLDEQESGGGFLDWLRNNFQNFISRIRTKDPGLNTSAGERPGVKLAGEANPGRMATQSGDANTQLKAQRDVVTDQIKSHPGQQNIQPKEVNENKAAELSPEVPVKIEMSVEPTVADYADAPLPADVRSKADDLLKPKLQSSLVESKAKTEQIAKARNEDKASEISKAESETAEINRKADADQRNIVVENRREVARKQQEGIADAYGQVNEFNQDASTKQSETRKEIGDKVKDSEGKARAALEQGEADAEKKKLESEREAEAKRNELRNEQNKQGWWDRAVSVVKKAVKVVTSAIDIIFTIARQAVKDFIEKAKQTAIGLINGARNFVVDKLNAFRDWAKDKVNKYLKDRFPELARRINNGIDAVVTTAIQGVNAVADSAIATVEALANGLAAALDKILGVFQTALKAAVQIVGAVVTGDFAEALRIAIQAACDIAGIDSKPIFDFIDRAAAQIMGILREPKKFFNNVMHAIGGGVRNFVKNIKQHLIKGLIGWLTGALSEVNITIPDKFDFKGILSLVLQILGLTYENIKARVIKKYPPAAKVFDVVEETFDIVKRIIDAGPSLIALWKMFEESLSNLKEMVLSSIRSFVITTVIKEAVTWLLGLLNPAGALVKILKLIYDFVMFLIERFNQIKDFVLSVYNSISAIASGALTKAIAAVEDAMSRSLPVVISLLASLAGLGGIGKTVKDIIGRVRKPIDKVLDIVIDKIISFAKRLVKGGKAVTKKAWEKTKDLILPKRVFEAGGETHTISFRKSGQLVIRSTPIPAEQFLNNIESKQGDSLSKAQKDNLKEARMIIKHKIMPLNTRIQEKRRTAPTLLQEMLQLEIELSNRIRLLLGKDSSLLGAREKYKLEGMTGTYVSLPKVPRDRLTPDHQPQAAILKWAANQPYFKNEPKGQKMVERAAGKHADQGRAILLHEIRHAKGRTYGSEGKKTKQEFIKEVKSQVPSLRTPAKKREGVVNIIKEHLKADVTKMKDVYRASIKDPVWKDIRELKIGDSDKNKMISNIRTQTRRGEGIIASQDMESLKGK